MRHVCGVLLVCLCMLPMCCQSVSTTDAGGGGTEITNGVAGRILTSDGDPAVGASVRIRSADYISRSSGLTKSQTYENAQTDSTGYFELQGIELGDHRIEINDAESSAVLLSCSITETTALLDLGVDTLRPFATISGTLQGYESWGTAVVTVHGLERSVPVDSNGTFVLNDLPGGTFRLLVMPDDNSALAIELDSVAVAPGQTVNVVGAIATLDPIADAFVRGGASADANHGSDSIITVKEAQGADLDYNRNGYLRFDVSSIASASKAVLRVYGRNMDDNAGVLVTSFGCDSDAWTETGITWNNAPSTSSTLGTAMVTGTAAYWEFDVTSFVKSQLSGDGVVTMCLKASDESNKVIFLNSRECSTRKPQLAIAP